MQEEQQLHKSEDDELLMSLVEIALSRPPDEREGYLREACAGTPRVFDTAWGYVQWEQRMQGFLQEPLIPRPADEPVLHADDLLDGRFRIVREVAEGGMGVVYEAWDEKLERRIAIKCAKAGFRKRLPPEVRSASEISHPHVCKIHEIHTAKLDGEEIEFLTMEFLEGETLLERLRRGPIARKEAGAIARQLCEGLAEAHRKQVIHGDLKTGNVILATAADGGMRAVITDFGLARRPASPSLRAQSSQLGGTPDYMAPELLKGGKPSVSSDVYALGVILYTLAAGRQPFPPDAAWQTRIEGQPPGLKHPWNAVLQRCLHPDPARRFQDADEIARALAPAGSRRKWLIGASVLLLAISTYIGAGRRTPAPSESVRLAALPFESAQDTASLAADLLRETAAKLARLKGNTRTRFAFVPLAETLNGKADSVQKAGAVLGATHALYGSVRRENGRVRLHVYLTNTHSLVHVREWNAEYGPGEERYMPAALAGVVTGTLRLPLAAAPAPVNAAARPDYQAGLLALRRESTVDSAIEHLSRAVAADPDSPLTHAALAEAQWFRYNLTRDPRWLARATASVAEAERRNPDLAPVWRIAGLLQSNAGRYELAEAAYRRAIELEPENSDAYRRLGIAYERSNQLDEALLAYLQAAEAEPDYYRNYQALGSLYNKRASYDEAVESFEKTVSLAPDEPAAHYALGMAYSRSGRFAESEKEYRLSISIKETQTAWHALGTILMYQGKDQDAIPCFQRALERWPERHLSWITLGICYRRVHQAASSQSANQHALDLAEKEVAREPRVAVTRAQLAYVCARLGERRRAESEVSQALQLSPKDADVRWWAVNTYEALGRRDDAVAALRDASREVIAELSRWPDVADLRRDSRFLQLMASHNLK